MNTAHTPGAIVAGVDGFPGGAASRSLGGG